MEDSLYPKLISMECHQNILSSGREQQIIDKWFILLVSYAIFIVFKLATHSGWSFFAIYVLRDSKNNYRTTSALKKYRHSSNSAVKVRFIVNTNPYHHCLTSQLWTIGYHRTFVKFQSAMVSFTSPESCLLRSIPTRSLRRCHHRCSKLPRNLRSCCLLRWWTFAAWPQTWRRFPQSRSGVPGWQIRSFPKLLTLTVVPLGCLW